MPVGMLLKLRLFLEGIEVPIISASLNIQPNAPAQCHIQIPATDKSFEFKPRTLVHVFFYDMYEGAGDSINVQNAQEPQTETVADQLERVAEARRAEEERLESLLGASSDSSLGGLLGGAAAAAGLDAAASTTAIVDSVLSSDSGPSSIGRMDDSRAGADSPDTSLDSGKTSAEEDDKWKLFFTGEVMGFQFNKSHNQRSITLECLDHSVYWDTCYQYKVNVASLTGDHMAAFVGAGTTFFDTFFASGMSYIVSAVTRRSVTQPELTGLLSGVVRLLESVGGVYIGNEARDLYGLNPQNRQGHFKGVNDFFSIAELRLKLVYMITAAEGDESSRRHFARRAFAMWGRRRAARLGKIASFREILNSMMQFIYHTAMPCPIARYQHPVDREQTATSVQLVSFQNTRRGRTFASQLNSLASNCSSVSSSLQSAPVGSNRVSGIVASCRSLGTTASSVGHTNLVNSLNATRAAAQSLLRRAVSGSIPNNSETQRFASTMSSRASTAAGYTRNITVRQRRRQTRSIHIGERLHSQIVKPDIFMCSPPRCNIIFPEHASQIQFARQYMREVTRMRLKVSDQIFGPDSLLDRAYYAPDVEVMGALPPRRRHGRGSEAGQIQGNRFSRAAYSKRIMDHELYVGVVPVFETMNEVNIYAARTDLVTHQGARIPYAIRAVNHQFFKHRWSPRQLSVSGRFNPYIAPGFPTVVLDRYMTESQLLASSQRVLEAELLTAAPEVEEHDQAAFDSFFQNPPSTDSSTGVGSEVAGDDDPESVWNILRETVPNQFVGLAEGVQHAVNQDQAATTVNLTHARIHRESEELLGSNQVPLTRRSLLRITRTRGSGGQTGSPGGGSSARQSYVEGRAIRRTTVAALSPPQLGDVGPYSGEVVEVLPSTETGFLPIYGPHFGDRARRTWTRVEVGQSRLPVEYGPEAVVLAGEQGESEDSQITFNPWIVVEAIDRWRGQIVEVPLEDFIRPPWMADVWRNDRIGSVYQQFFGTGAITDSMIINASQALMSLNEADPTSDIVSGIESEVDAAGASAVSQGLVVQRPGMTITIERSIDLLTRMYSLLRHAGNADIHEFIRAYTWRPVATLTEMLGSEDLELNPDTGEKVSGTEGFHSRAFGRKEMGQNLRNLVDEEVRSILDFDAEEDRGSVLERMDKRSEKADKVLQYVSELYDSRGLLG